MLRLKNDVAKPISITDLTDGKVGRVVSADSGYQGVDRQTGPTRMD